MTNLREQTMNILSKGKLVGDRYWFLYTRAGMTWYQHYKFSSAHREGIIEQLYLDDIHTNQEASIRHYILNLSRFSRFFIRDSPVCDLIDEIVVQCINNFYIRQTLLKFKWTELQLIDILQSFLGSSTSSSLYNILKYKLKLDEAYDATRMIMTHSSNDVKIEGDKACKPATSKADESQLVEAYMYGMNITIRHMLNDPKLCNALDDLHMYLDRPFNVWFSLGSRVRTEQEQLLPTLNWCLQNATLLNGLTEEQEKQYVMDQFSC